MENPTTKQKQLYTIKKHAPETAENYIHLAQYKNEGTEEEEHVDGELTQGPITLEVFQKRMRKKYITYIDLFELIIPSNLFSIRKSEEVREELNESLRKLASSVKSQYKQIGGDRALP